MQIFRRPDLGGRVFAAYTHDTGYAFVEHGRAATRRGARASTSPPTATARSSPTSPTPTTRAPCPSSRFAQGSHNVTVHPSGRYLYNSNSDLITSSSRRSRSPTSPTLAHPRQLPELALKTFPGLGTESHDITFNADGTRAYVAALSHARDRRHDRPGASRSRSASSSTRRSTSGTSPRRSTHQRPDPRRARLPDRRGRGGGRQRHGPVPQRRRPRLRHHRRPGARAGARSATGTSTTPA